MCGDPPHGLGPGDFPEQGGPSSHINTSTADLLWKLGITLLGGCGGGGNVGGMFVGGGGVRLKG